MLPKGILFDLDDTIISYGAVAKAAWLEVCERYFQECGQESAEALNQALLEKRRWYWRDSERHVSGRLNLPRTRREIVGLTFADLGIDNQPLADEIGDAYSETITKGFHLFPGAIETLEYFQKNNVALVMMTNGAAEPQRAKIDRFNLEKHFSLILVEGEMGYGKPDERVYTRALEYLQMEPADVWAVGDNLEWDVGGPQKLGIYGIWNNARNEKMRDDCSIIPDRTINAITELVH